MSKPDLYLQFGNFYKRIEMDYQRFGSLIIAVDFDETVFNTHERPDGSFDQVIALLRRWRPYARFIIWSCSNPVRYDFIRERCDELGVPYDTINEPIHKSSKAEFADTRKVYANVYFDDRAGLGWAYAALARLIGRIERGEIHPH